MSSGNIKVLVSKHLKQWGFALFSKKIKILPNNKVPEYLKDFFFNDEKAILGWNLLSPEGLSQEKSLVIHVDWMRGDYFRIISPYQEEFLYTERISLKELRNKIAQILCLTSVSTGMNKKK